MSVTNSPNMSLPIPGVGTEAGPDYAIDVNNCLTLIDSHDHTPGRGVAITPDAININTNLSFANNFAIDVAGVALITQGSTPANNTIYESGVDLYYVDGVGNNVRITQSGGVAGSPGSISGLVSPASATYVSGSSTFVWQSNTSIAANMDFGSAIFRNLSPNSTFGVTLQAPTALASNYALTLPALPGAISFMTLDSSGAMAATIPVASGITNSMIAANTITGNRLVNNTLDQTQISTSFRQIQKQFFTTSGTFTTPVGTSSNTVYKATVIGGGGAGACWTGGGAGGGAGGTVIVYFTGYAASSPLAVAIGVAGGAVVANASNGGNGGDTTLIDNINIITIASAEGGKGGIGAGGINAGGLGGFLSTSISGGITIGGQSGTSGTSTNGTDVGQGTGGSSSIGGGGAGGIVLGSTRSGTACDALGYGGGGGGVHSGTSGAGKAGIVIIEWMQ